MTIDVMFPYYGDVAMMKAAVEAAASVPNRPKVIAVTVLTSLEQAFAGIESKLSGR